MFIPANNNMTYELAKKLKEAGFRDNIYLYFEYKEVGNAPTLSELIERCGEDFEMVRRIFEYKTDIFLYWLAECTNKKAICISGSTPEEAVANLWLELNKK